MAKERITAEDMNAWQRAHNYQRLCSVCVREFYMSLVRECPVRGRSVCMYCCRGCGESRPEFVGQGCRARRKEEHDGRNS